MEQSRREQPRYVIGKGNRLLTRRRSEICLQTRQGREIQRALMRRRAAEIGISKNSQLTRIHRINAREFRRGLREFMRKSGICYLVLASAVHFLNVEVALAQELSVEDRACITGAVAKLPPVAALNIEGSRAIGPDRVDHSGRPAFRRSSAYLAQSFGPRNGQRSVRLETHKPGSIWRMRSMAFFASSSRPAYFPTTRCNLGHSANQIGSLHGFFGA